jgi:hypothetical protein
MFIGHGRWVDGLNDYLCSGLTESVDGLNDLLLFVFRVDGVPTNADHLLFEFCRAVTSCRMPCKGRRKPEDDFDRSQNDSRDNR